jgi:hypothetical protein
MNLVFIIKSVVVEEKIYRQTPNNRAGLRFLWAQCKLKFGGPTNAYS